MAKSADQKTKMFAEAGAAADAVDRQLHEAVPAIAALISHVRANPPALIFTCARGSSDHAATFAKYLFETRLRIPTLSQAPSISSIYGAPLLHMEGALFLLISQSGRSHDLLLSAEAAKKAGAFVVALVNDVEAPLAGLVDLVIPLCAGPEKSIAATKSYIASLAALAQIVAAWAQDDALTRAVRGLPAVLHQAWAADWSAALELFDDANSLYVLGRGLTLGVAQEAALKFKETCGVHAEAFSIAEVAHGPMALVKPGFPLLVFPPLDKAVTGLEPILAQFAERDARIARAGKGQGEQLGLPIPANLHPVTGPIAMIQSFYRLCNTLALHRGLDPDHPPLLNKVTNTR